MLLIAFRRQGLLQLVNESRRIKYTDDSLDFVVENLEFLNLKGISTIAHRFQLTRLCFVFWGRPLSHFLSMTNGLFGMAGNTGSFKSGASKQALFGSHLKVVAASWGGESVGMGVNRTADTASARPRLRDVARYTLSVLFLVPIRHYADNSKQQLNLSSVFRVFGQSPCT